MADLGRHYDGSNNYTGGTATGPGNRTNVYAVKEFLERARPHDIFIPAADMKPVPMYKNETVSWRRVVNDAVSTTEITEGVNPDWQSISYEDVTGTFEERVEIYAVTSRARDLSEDDHRKANVDQLKDKVMRIRTAVAWSKWLAGTSVVYNDPSHSARTSVNGPVSLGILQEAIRLLDDAKGITFTEVDNGGMENGTVGLEPAYIAFCHTNLLPDVRRIDGFTKVSEYGGSDPISKFERGSIEHLRFLMSPELTAFAGGGATATGLNLKATDVSGTDKVDVYPILITAKNALGCADLKGSGSKGWGGVDVKILDGADKADPAGLNDLFVAHWYDLHVILNDNWLVRLEVGATSDLTQL